MKNAKQLKDLIKNMGREKGINPQVLHRIYMMERLLERISLSEYKSNFILKGGMLVAALIGVDMRATVDMDATMKSYAVTKESIEDVFKKVFSIQLDDGVTFEIKKVYEIREEDDYRGFSVSLDALMENVKIPIKVDITTGDKITPKEITYEYKLMFEERNIGVLAYNVETVLAEKFEAVLSRGVTNTRMRDFYDLHVLLKTQRENIDIEVLKEAVLATAIKRKSVEKLKEGRLILEEIFLDALMSGHWSRYQKKFSYAKGVTWLEILKMD
ncbi:MAG: nucleotidyl transferase AbiEii/AbiGii toxin family protein [Bacillota bacterium]|nr:nucleotidyl transferase AbiEii/AbiGii toxin family protein [Bacillota bacterium]